MPYKPVNVTDSYYYQQTGKYVRIKEFSNFMNDIWSSCLYEEFKKTTTSFEIWYLILIS